MSVTSETVYYDQLRSITESKILPGIEDAITKDHPLLSKFLKNARKLDGGYNIQKVIRYANSTQGGPYSGDDELDTAQEENRTRAYWSWRFEHQPIPLFNEDLLKNGGQAKVLDYLALASEDAMLSLKDKFGTQLYTAQTGKNIDSLVDACDDYTNVDSYGGITRSTYSWWQGQYDGTGGTLSLSMIASQIDSQTNGNIEPDMIVTTKDLWTAMEAQLMPQMRFSGESADGGLRKLTYRGIPIVRDEYCTATYMYFLNTKFLEMVVGNHSEFKTDSMGFAISPFRQAINQDGKISYILWAGNLICTNPKYQGVIRTVTA